MAISLETTKPLSFNEWTELNSTNFILNYDAYLEYLKLWYANRKELSGKKTTSLRQNYIELIQDLTYFFTEEEKELFLNELDYENDLDLIKAVPYFARKLKEISQILCNKRESLKDSKLKYNLISSNQGVEKLLYDYILKGFTQRSDSYTQIPVPSIKNSLPSLSAIKDHFYVEIEELYDSQNYQDSDPNVHISQYVNIKELFLKNPTLNQDTVIKLLATRLFPRVAENENSFYYKKIINSAENSTEERTSLNNLIDVNKKYLGETVYTLTASRIEENKIPLKLTFEEGNNWFYWPSGEKILDTGLYDNVYEPILINDSNFYKSGATAGSKPSESDLIYVERNGMVEGAWLNGSNQTEVTASIKLFLESQKTNEFIFPYVGYKLDPKTLEWGGHLLTNLDNYYKYDLLDINLQNKILQQYFFETLPLSSSLPIYLNNTNLNELSDQSSTFSDEADVIIKRENLKSRIDVYKDYSKLPSEEAFLYKPIKTDLPVSLGLNFVYWPFIVFDENYNIPINSTPDVCEPVYLGNIVPGYPMGGAISGFSYATSDVIFKYEGRSENVIEAAWLGAPPVSSLDTNNLNTSIKVYSTSAVTPPALLDGPVQCALALYVPPNTRESFVWCDQDTYADEVFTYKPHSVDCEYGRSLPHNYSKDLSRVNPQTNSNLAHWKKCTCKSVIFSPIGHDGEVFSDYNGAADYLFADPFGLGENFLVNSWFDTRGFDVSNSPQFSFYQLNSNSTEPRDFNMGWGPGSWKTSSGDRMVLKTGQRYTYYRSSLKTPGSLTSEDRMPPYFVVNYAYKNLQVIGVPGNPVDLCIIVDNSGSQSSDIIKSKEVATKLINDLLPLVDEYGRNLFQISLVSFDLESSLVQILTQNEEKDILLSQLQTISVPEAYPEYTTNINKGLKEAYNILTTSGTYTFEGIKKNNTPNSNPLTLRKILLLSDGVENQDIGLSISTAADIKAKDIAINVVSLASTGAIVTPNNRLLFQIASDTDTYFDYAGYQASNSEVEKSFENFYRNILNTLLKGTAGKAAPKTVGWRKAVKNVEGQWIGLEDPSDMIIRPGDFLGYLHRPECSYDAENNSDFNQRAISFPVNIPLKDSLGRDGAKPFWGKMYNSPQEISTVQDNRFNKETNILGGHIRFYNDYVPIHQPEVSDMVLNNGDFIQYNLKGIRDLIWEQPITMNVLETQNKWKKLIFYKGVSNLKDLPLKNGNIDKIGYGSDEDSSLPLVEFSLYKKTFYNYYARKPFSLEEGLTRINNCKNNRMQITTAVAISPTQPYSNLTNRFYPTVATINYPELLISEKDTGFYLTPDKLGVSTYRGRGYNNVINEEGIDLISQKNTELLFISPHKYGFQNRGLTQNNQYAPVITLNVDSLWMLEPLHKNKKTGIYKDVLVNQKLIPYQSSYEILNQNSVGLSRQGTSSILVDQGDLINWRVDLFGNDYGLYKEIEEEIEIEEENKGPIIITQPQSITNLYNVSTSINVLASAVRGPLYYYWYKNDKMFYVGSSSLNFESLQASDEGVYQVYVRSVDGAVYSQEAIIEVLSPPVIYYQTENLIQEVGSTITLAVMASGSGNLTYQWHNEIGGAINTALSSVLVIENVQKINSGNYYCIVSNEIGSVTSDFINIDIGYAPGLTSPLSSYRLVRRGSNVLLNLSVSGDEPLTIKWYNYGATLTSNIIYEYPYTVNQYNAIITNRFGIYRTNVVTISSYETLINLPDNGIVTYDDEYIVDESGNYIIWT